MFRMLRGGKVAAGWGVPGLQSSLKAMSGSEGLTSVVVSSGSHDQQLGETTMASCVAISDNIGNQLQRLSVGRGRRG
ncbi:hypothetical protein B296_00054669 [Ensete ventricosum]|uniref:Uncharacterized protein n=1 Tax=Ensete ventricosum TaxID=4639 RepID=A0A426XLV4_ENSVE|nr:hypothetical protein B296_00054669 [Ensete ventricosum]